MITCLSETLVTTKLNTSKSTCKLYGLIYSTIGRVTFRFTLYTISVNSLIDLVLILTRKIDNVKHR